MKNIEAVAKILANTKRTLEKLDTSEMASISLDRGIHLGSDTFVNYLKELDFEVVDRDSMDYPYELTTVVHGIRVFALTSEDQYKEAFPESLTPGQRRIAELEAEIEAMKQSHNEMGLNDRP